MRRINAGSNAAGPIILESYIYRDKGIAKRTKISSDSPYIGGSDKKIIMCNYITRFNVRVCCLGTND